MKQDASTLTTALTKAEAAAEQALSDIAGLVAAAEQSRDSLTNALRQAQRMAGLSQFDKAALQEFLEKPYLSRPLGEGQYELIVPRFIGFRAGWPVRHEGAYSIFRVSKFIHFINPLPDWMAAEFGFGKPTFQANLEGNVLTITQGDSTAAYEKLGGAKTIARREGPRLYLRPASRFDILRRIIREEGFLPYTPQPVPEGLLREPQIARLENGEPAFRLRPHQERDYRRFLETGAASLFAYPQTGKSFIPLMACAAIAGPKLILCPRRSLVDQWQARLALYLAPEAAGEVIVTTYQGAKKHLYEAYSLVVFDEAHHLPADFAIEAAATIQAAARLSLSATPRREDGNEDLIPALGGWPMGADWPVTASQRPPVTVWLVRDEPAKLRLMRRLCEKPVDGKTFIFTYQLSIGERAARQLSVPFVYSRTKKPLDVIGENDTVVISSVGNEGLSFPVRRVIEISFLFGSGMEAGQRLGRLAFEITGKDKPGEHHILMTRDEYQRYSKRLLIYEQWGLDVDVRSDMGEAHAPRLSPIPRRSRRAPAPRPSQTTASAARQPAAELPVPESDEIAATLALPAIAAKVKQAQQSVGGRTAPYLPRILRFCWAASLSPEEIAEGLGITDEATLSRYRSAAKALTKVGLLRQVESDGGRVRYAVNEDEVQRLRALSNLRTRAA